ncbi:MAG: D-alanyl-D-alanine carboxypeptidase [Erysipelotrichaceae bacterium]|nr:D-alanyl-D-alanine carboxypeptidase [Erysipelotrichaceae bacterium]MCI9312338.1 D-alanyl-D-alanine carboxypeptidase [Erysipelotrichaceae bacterium]
MKKIVCFLLAVVLCGVFAAGDVHAEETPRTDTTTDLAPNAKSAYLMEFTSGKLIYAKNEHEKLYPASMTKMMGLLLIYEALHNNKLSWDEMIVTSEHAASMGGSQVFLEVNEQMSVRDMVKSICIASANDAMVAMAERVGGTHEGFVQMMNDKAKELQLNDTHFVNATGLHDPQHYTSAYDMAFIAQALVKEGGDELLEITSTYDAYIRESGENKFWLVNTNKLLKQYPGVDGLKTGFTQEAMSCITVTAVKNNLRLISVVMGEPNSKQRNAEIKTMLDYGFSQFEQGLLFPAGTLIETRKLDNGKPGEVGFVTKSDLRYVYAKGSEPHEADRKVEITKTQLPYLPNDTVGKVTITMDDGFVMEAELTVDHEVQPLDYLDLFMKSFKDFLI